MSRHKKIPVWLFSGLSALAILIRIALVYRQNIFVQPLDWTGSWYLIPFSIVLMAFSLSLAAWVWSDLMIALGSNIPFTTHLRYYLITQLSRRIPGKVWFLAGRGYLYQQEGESLRTVAVASGIEWAISGLSGGLVSLIAANYALNYITNGQRIILGLTLLAALLLIQPRTILWLTRLIKLEDAPKVSYGNLCKWLGVYGLLWVAGAVIFYFIANVVTDVPIVYFPHILSSWSLIGAVSILIIFIPTNLGLSEIGLGFLLAQIMPASIGIVVAVLAYVLFLLYEIIAITVILVNLSPTKILGRVSHIGNWLSKDQMTIKVSRLDDL